MKGNLLPSDLNRYGLEDLFIQQFVIQSYLRGSVQYSSLILPLEFFSFKI